MFDNQLHQLVAHPCQVANTLMSLAFMAPFPSLHAGKVSSERQPWTVKLHPTELDLPVLCCMQVKLSISCSSCIHDQPASLLSRSSTQAPLASAQNECPSCVALAIGREMLAKTQQQKMLLVACKLRAVHATLPCLHSPQDVSVSSSAGWQFEMALRPGSCDAELLTKCSIGEFVQVSLRFSALLHVGKPAALCTVN